MERGNLTPLNAIGFEGYQDIDVDAKCDMSMAGFIAVLPRIKSRLPDAG
jgi:hypothetical protein